MAKKKFLSSDKIVSLSAFLISIGTLFTIVYQTRLIRQQQYASVLPYLEIWQSDNDNERSVNLYNNGIGPAIIKDFKIYFKDSVYAQSLGLFYRNEILDSTSRLKYSRSDMSKGMLLPAGSRWTLISATKEDSIKSLKRLLKEYNPDIEITYSSIYGETWVMRDNGKPPVKLD